MLVGRTCTLMLLGVLYFTVTTEGIKCWFCDSILDSFCSDPFDNSTANIKDCSLEEGLPHQPIVPATMCSKIRMKVNGHWRYKRDCAWSGKPGVRDGQPQCITLTNTSNIIEYYCCDDENGCNPAPATRPSLPLVALLGLSGVAGCRWWLQN